MQTLVWQSLTLLIVHLGDVIIARYKATTYIYIIGDNQQQRNNGVV